MTKNPVNVRMVTPNEKAWTNSVHLQRSMIRKYGIQPVRPNEALNLGLSPVALVVKQIIFNIQAGMRLGC